VRLRGEVHRLVAPRDQKYQSNFVEVWISFSSFTKTIESFSFILMFHLRVHLLSFLIFFLILLNLKNQFRNYKIVYRRYAGLFFCICVDANDNELAYLEAIHFFVEVLGTSALVPAVVSKE